MGVLYSVLEAGVMDVCVCICVRARPLVLDKSNYGTLGGGASDGDSSQITQDNRLSASHH